MRLVLALLLALLARPLLAAPAIGAALPRFTLEDADRHEHALSDSHLPIVLIWEDETSSKHRQRAHAIVGRYSDNAANRGVFQLIAVADLARWSYWPARHYARNAFWKEAGKKQVTPVFIDWKGALRSAFDLRKGESAFFVLDGDHRVRYFAQGAALDEAQCAKLDAAIAALGATPIR